VAVAETLRGQLKRSADMVARYGGEEFMLILPDVDDDGAVRVAEKLRHAVEEMAIAHAHSSAGPVVTVSAGTATMVPDRENGAEHLLREADIALYRAKRMGRNQVHSASLRS
jgi:diguanylate cyclase (GGDEF)-like protein